MRADYAAWVEKSWEPTFSLLLLPPHHPRDKAPGARGDARWIRIRKELVLRLPRRRRRHSFTSGIEQFDPISDCFHLRIPVRLLTIEIISRYLIGILISDTVFLIILLSRKRRFITVKKSGWKNFGVCTYVCKCQTLKNQSLVIEGRIEL